MKNNFDIIASAIPSYGHELMLLDENIKSKATDIRFSVGFSPVVFMGRKKYILKSVNPFTKVNMQDLVFSLCDYSVYKHQEEIKQGFISVKKRFRAGICGTAVKKGSEIENIDEITSVIIRVSRMVYGAAEEIRKILPNVKSGVLIVGEPSSGKTTVLKDLIVILSESRAVVLDERYELTGGFSSTDLDVLYGYPKNIGINHAVRNLGTEYIICDEIEEKDIPSIKNAVSSGVKIIATIHGEVKRNLRPFIKELLKVYAFDFIVEMDKRENAGKIKKVWNTDDLLENFGRDNDYSGAYIGRA